jgi:hypothetical protein
MLALSELTLLACSGSMPEQKLSLQDLYACRAPLCGDAIIARIRQAGVKLK